MKATELAAALLAVSLSATIIGSSARASGALAPAPLSTLTRDGGAPSLLPHAGDVVRTPVGGLHRSCVHHLPPGASVDDDDRVTQRGRIVSHFEPCAYAPLPDGAAAGNPDAGAWGWYVSRAGNAYQSSR